MKLKTVMLLIIAAALLHACNKEDDFNYPEGTVGSSRITNFPTLALKGDDYMAIPVGSTYTDSGVVAQEAGADIAYTTDGAVNTSTAGVYRLNYTAVNKDGFSASVSRWVAVYKTDEDAASHDLSGTYLRASNGVTNSWTKLAPGVYKVVNPGGAAGATLTAVLFNSTGYTIKIPSQQTNDGNTTSSKTETYTPGSPATYSMVILNSGYGTALRTFTKQ